MVASQRAIGSERPSSSVLPLAMGIGCRLHAGRLRAKSFALASHSIAACLRNRGLITRTELVWAFPTELFEIDFEVAAP